MRLTDIDFVETVTSQWSGPRDERGRPLVPDDILERMEQVTTEEAWGVLRRNGYHHNFAGGWNILHADRVLVGRAVTCRFVPTRPDLDEAVSNVGENEGRVGGQNSWVIDELQEDDVIVVDLFGKIRDGTFAGDNLSTAIKAKTNRGMVIEGGIRDTQRIMELDEFNAFVRGFDPTAIANVTLTEINGPIKIGDSTCLPGDVVLGTVEGVIFIPPHLAEAVVVSSEEVRLKDEFGQLRIRQGVYTPGEVDRQFSDEMARDFEEWKQTRSKS